MRAILPALVVVAALGAAGSSHAARLPGEVVSVQACARLRDLHPPLEAARSLADVPLPERRTRLIGLLQADLASRGARVRDRLRGAGARSPRMVWTAGVICAAAPPEVWDLIARLPEVDAVHPEVSQPEQRIDDAGPVPNSAVPAEPPLVSLRVPEAWQRGFTGRGVVIALIDTGLDFTHPDLAHAVWTNPGEIASNDLDDDGNGYVDDVRGWDFASNDNDPTDNAGHGTNVAGLIVGNGVAGKQTGAAPGARLMVLRRGTTESSLWQASQYAIENGADLINQSVSWKWSFVPKPNYSAWRRQAETELAVGILHVNSAGNSGELLDSEPIPYNIAAPANCPPPWHHPQQSPPAGVSSVIAVGVLDARSHAISARSPYGPSEWTDIATHRDATYPWGMPLDHQDYPTWNGGTGLSKPDLVAPGDWSQTTKLAGGYVQFDGTSAATPRVTAILALMKQAVPDATPAELTRALLTSANDLGPLGRDLRFGVGMPQADLAIDALGPSLRLISQVVSETGPPRADGDGSVDAGEIVTLTVAVQNTSTVALNAIDLVLRSSSVAIVRDQYAHIASLAGGATVTVTPSFTIEIPAGTCAQQARFELELRQAGKLRLEPLVFPIGGEVITTLLEDDFEVDRGFTVNGTATAGQWVRQVPVGTSDDGEPANPSADATAGTGAIAWVTGNGSSDPNAADVDNGRTRLVSPARNAIGFARVELGFSRWFYGDDVVGEDHLTIEAAPDGSTWKLIEDVSASDNLWRRRRLVLSDLIAPGSSTQLRFVVEDAVQDDLVEGALDDFSLIGVSLSCTPFTIAPASPGPIGSSLRLAKLAATHLELTWLPPSAQGGIDPPRGYRVTHSPTAQAGFTQLGLPVATRYVAVDAAQPTSVPITFYLVEPLN